MIDPTTLPAGVVDPLSADRLAIMRLVDRFENAFDAGDFAAHLATWADDMVFRSPFGDFDDKRDYEQWLRGFHDWARRNFGGTRHLITNFDIGIDGADAVSTCYLIVLGRKGPTMAGTCVCTDTLRKTGDEWLIVRRDLVVDQEFDMST